MQVKTTGFDELDEYIVQMQKNLDEFSNTNSVTFEELFTPEFMKLYTSFDDIDDLVNAGDFELNSPEDFNSIPNNVLDKHIAKYTDFSSWQDMLDTATTEYASRKLGF